MRSYLGVLCAEPVFGARSDEVREVFGRRLGGIRFTTRDSSVTHSYLCVMLTIFSLVSGREGGVSVTWRNFVEK